MKLLRQILGPFLALLLTFGSVVEVSAPITVAAAGVVLGVGHAQAATPAQKAVVLNGVPGWVLRASGALPSIDMDFAHNRAWVGGSGPRAPPSLLTTTRASTGYAQWADGHLSSFAANVPRITDLGLLVEQAATNVVLWNRDLTNAAWTKSNITAALNQTGADGTANAATSLTATAGNGTCLQAITLASSARFQSAYVKRITGTGTINMTMDNGATWTAITVTSSYTQLTIPTQTLANPTVGFRIVTSGDAIAVDFVGNETGTFATSPIATTTVAVTRAADNIVGGLPWYNTARGTLFVSATTSADLSVPQAGLVSINDNSTNNRIFIRANSTNLGRFVVSSGGVTQTQIGTGTIASSVAVKAAASWIAGTANVAVNGSLATAGTPASIPTGLTQLQIGAVEGGSLYLNNYIKRVAYFPSALSTAQLQALTT